MPFGLQHIVEEPTDEKNDAESDHGTGGGEDRESEHSDGDGDVDMDEVDDQSDIEDEPKKDGVDEPDEELVGSGVQAPGSPVPPDPPPLPPPATLPIGLLGFEISPTSKAQCWLCKDTIIEGGVRLSYRATRAMSFPRHIHVRCGRLLPPATRAVDYNTAIGWNTENAGVRESLDRLCDDLKPAGMGGARGSAG